MKTKTPPPITNSQKKIILFLYKFRFIKISQLQKYFHHKDPKRIKEWLKDLKNKKYISVVVDKDITKPYIFCLASGARHILKENENISTDFLNKLYKEKDLTLLFKNHCLFLLDIYLFFLTHKEKDTKVIFCTKHELTDFDYLPKELDAYIAVENKEETKRYFLELFDEYQSRQSPGKIRFSIRTYISYVEEGNWQAGTDNSLFPAILFVLPNERRKQFAFHYGKAKLSKTFEDIPLFLTTQDTIKFSKNNQNIWQQVTTD